MFNDFNNSEGPNETIAFGVIVRFYMITGKEIECNGFSGIASFFSYKETHEKFWITSFIAAKFLDFCWKFFFKDK